MRVHGFSRRHSWLGLAFLLTPTVVGPAFAQLSKPGTAPAQGPSAPEPTPTPTPTPAPGVADGAAPSSPDADIVPDTEFNAALPPLVPTLSDDINAPLEPIPSTTPTPAPVQGGVPIATGETLAPVSPEDPQIAAPLSPLNTFDTTPLETAADVADADAPEVRYDTEIKGLADTGLEGQWKALSALRDGGGEAANAIQVQARAKEDEALAIRLLKSLGYYDATAISVIEPVPPTPGRPTRFAARVTATPGRLYTLSAVNLQAGPVTPPDLLTENFALRVGDPIEAARIQGAEANLLLVLPQRGYPFVEIGERDILLEDQSDKAVGAYTLPVTTGPRASFGQLVTAGDPVFDLKHLKVFPRFDQGDLFDRRLSDDLRDALVATGLFSTLAVEPQRTGRINPDGTEQVDLLVRQTRGPARSLNGNVGYSTGQGFRIEGNWTHRNLFPPEGALIASVVAGTQEQGVSGTFRRSNAGRRDRTFTVVAAANRSNFDAFEAFTGTLSARWSYDSTPIWQKRITYFYGGELIGTNESVFDFARNERVRRTYGIAALPAQIQWDTSDDLLNPTRGYRLKLNVSPETSVQGSVRPYARTLAEGTIYYPVNDSLVIAGRARAGSILGVARDDLAPSRRYYGGGGGSVRGYGFQRLGPFEPVSSLVPNEDGEIDLADLRPVGGRSVTEFAIEARYRFGNFGIVPFVDAGNSYESSTPGISNLKIGAGIGGRFYTNFGPFRIDVATPLNPRKGDSKVALYISIGQAF